MRLIVPPAAVKELSEMPQRDREALMAKLAGFAASPFERHPWAQPLRGARDVVRIRQGDWRAVCRIDRSDETVVIDAVAHRKEVYC